MFKREQKGVRERAGVRRGREEKGGKRNKRRRRSGNNDNRQDKYRASMGRNTRPA